MFRLQDRGIGGVPAVVLEIGEPLVVGQRGHQSLLCGDLLLQLRTRDERIIDIAECVLNRKLVVLERGLRLRFSLRDLPAHGSEREDRTGQLSRVAPDARRSLEQIR